MKLYIILLVVAGSFDVGFTDECKVAPIFRQNCGWKGIEPETCESRGCCYDSSISGAIWCFERANSECEVLPNYRFECGWGGVTKETCEEKGCCFNSNTAGAKWCFKKNSM